MRLLDVGCGWGSMAMHAARQHGAQVVGITISQAQAAAARDRVHEAGLDDSVEIRLQDYRDVRGEHFDAISSIGMFEHVGKTRMADYFSTLRALLGPHGRLLNHAISSVGGSKLSTRGFIYRYVFPDGELIDVGDTVLAMEAAGFEVRDVESLREHYAQHAAVLGGEPASAAGRKRSIWWASHGPACGCSTWRRRRVGFGDGGLGLHQVLGVVPDADGASGMPRTRTDWG